MINPAIISEIEMLRAHASELFRTADSILKKLDAPERKGRGLTSDQKARIIAKRSRTLSRGVKI